MKNTLLCLWVHDLGKSVFLITRATFSELLHRIFETHCRSTKIYILLIVLTFPKIDIKYSKISMVTRMHSSRMRTACLLPVSPSMHCSQGGYLPRGCTCPGGCTCRGCTCPGGVPAQGVYPLGGCTCPGGYLPGGCTCPGGAPVQVLPPMDRHTCVKT